MTDYRQDDRPGNYREPAGRDPQLIVYQIGGREIGAGVSFDPFPLALRLERPSGNRRLDIVK